MPHDISLRLATPDDNALSAFDFTKLSAINSCPRYGIIRYTQHKTLTSGGFRAMALEAGSAAHECFSVVRLWQLGVRQGYIEHMHYHGERLFGAGRWSAIMEGMEGEDLTGLRMMVLNCLSSSGFTDDPEDKRRTYSNLETSLLYYCQRWDHDRYPVWVRDTRDCRSDVGIEIPFSMVVEVPAPKGMRAMPRPLFRYTGRIDGIHIDKNNELVIQENKTTSRISQAWRMAFNTSHQVTGYCVAASLFTGRDVSRGMVMGLSLPLPKSVTDGIAIEPVSRPHYLKEQWLEWVLHTVAMHDRFKDSPLEAPMYTGSCNRYFQPCQFIPLCAGDKDEQQLIMSEMRHDEWSPLDEAH